jgi:hypothetical protein
MYIRGKAAPTRNRKEYLIPYVYGHIEPSKKAKLQSKTRPYQALTKGVV